MDEQNPNPARPLPPTPPPAFYAPDSEPAAPKTERNRKGSVGLALAALALGTIGGFGGAAAYDAVSDDETGTNATETTSTTSPVRSLAPESSATGVEAVAESVLPSVVRIDVAGSNGAGSGSGIVLTADGEILTNAHVVGGTGEGTRLRVSFSDGSRAEATVLGSDPLTDTAVIKAEGVEDLTPATIGDSSALRVGQQVVAIGSPFGLDATVTSGIVSALDRPVNVQSDARGNSTTYPAVQTDAAINPGNSGGPLVDMEGRVVGINSSIRTTGSTSGEAGSIGLGFAIPIEPILPIIEQLSDGEPATHARLGITVSDPAADDTEAREGTLAADRAGALVRTVADDSTADRAGLQAGDLVVRIGERDVDGADDLVATVRTYRPGDEVTVTFVRDGDEETVTLTLDSDAD